MNRLIASALLSAGLALAVPNPAQADTNKDTPGGPCTHGPGQGTGNPCKGNNGNPSPEGNVGKEKITYDKHPAPFTISRPGNDRGAYITQVGDSGNATISQKANTQYARIDQDGSHDRAMIAQIGQRRPLRGYRPGRRRQRA